MVGFPEKTADIRMAQYESSSRTPKAELTESLAGALDISPLALSVPDIDSYLGLMHTLFTLEDRYGLTVETGENGVSLRVDPRKGKDAAELSEMLVAWAQQAERYRNGEINREDYDEWRYNYPRYDKASGHVELPSKKRSDAAFRAFGDKINEQFRQGAVILKINKLTLKDLQPSQFYISKKKLRAVEGWLDASD